MNSIFSTDRSRRKITDSDDLEIDLAGQIYPLKLRKMAQARSIGVTADTVRGEVRLTMPRYASTGQALRFAQSKSDWLAERFAEASPPVPIVDGTEINFLGEPHIIRWSEDYARQPLCRDAEIRVGGPQDRIESRIIRWMKDQARAAYSKDLGDYCGRAAVDRPQLSVGDARRRWGSCSGRGAIRLNWRLIMAPPIIRRSVVAHEVAHLRHMNHSAAFYALLDEIFEGDRQQADRWLKQEGPALYLTGAASTNSPD